MVAPVTGGRTFAIEVRDAASGWVVAGASLEDLIKFDMLTPRNFHSILKEAEKGHIDPFSIYHIPAVAAGRMQQNFTKRLGALVPVDEGWEVTAPGSGKFEEEEATIEGRVERSSVSVDDSVCIITDNGFDLSGDLLFQECAELPQDHVGLEIVPASSQNAFVFIAAAVPAVVIGKNADVAPVTFKGR